MGIEFILAMGLIVALSELKEWRAGERMRKLEALICALPENLRLAGEKNEAIGLYAQKAASELEILNRAIDAHGIRVNYKNSASGEQPDMIEGL